MKTILVYDNETEEIYGVFSEASDNICNNFDSMVDFTGKSYIEITPDHGVVSDTGSWYVDNAELKYCGSKPHHKFDRATKTLVLNKDKWFNREIRPIRNRLLKDSDYIMLPDVLNTMTNEKKTEWKNYRQALRDFTSTLTEYVPSEDLELPTKPI